MPQPNPDIRRTPTTPLFAPRGPRHYLGGPRRDGLKFVWTVEDHAVSPHRKIAEGRAWTQRGAIRDRWRAHMAELTRLAAERAHILDRDAATELRTDGPVT